MKVFRKRVYIAYRTKFDWPNWYGKWVHIYRVIFNKSMNVQADISSKDLFEIERR